MIQYIIYYQNPSTKTIRNGIVPEEQLYKFCVMADDEEHAIKQFRFPNPSSTIVLVWKVKHES